jgi:ABC-type polysaccharide/polyol phosphate export permease
MSNAERLAQLWYELFVRDLKARYKQTFLGGLWSLGSPLVELAVYAVVFGSVLRAPSDGAPYPLFAYVGVVMWTFVSGGLVRGTTSITSNAGLVSSVPFPKAAAPLAAVGAALFDALLSAVFLALALAYYRAPLTVNILWLVPLGGILLAFVTGLALLLSALNVFYRDIHHVVGLAVRLWLFLTPVVYASSAVPERYRVPYALNPLVGIFESVRLVLVQGRPPDWGALVYPAVAAALVLAVAALVFRATEPYFAETV